MAPLPIASSSAPSGTGPPPTRIARGREIVTELGAGRYRVWANTTKGALSGAYTLTVARR